MIITKEREYAVRAVSALSSKETTSARYICESTNISIDFMHKILRKLERNGIVRSIRGVNGGYRLVKELNKISLLDILLAVDENMFIHECLKPDYVCEFSDKKYELVQTAFQNVQSVMLTEFRKKTMDMLVKPSDEGPAA